MSAALMGLLAAGSAGCGRQAAEGQVASAPAVPRVATVRPTRKLLRHTIEQPARIQAFERTPIHAKISGYVQDVRVEIGSRVGKGDLLAELWVPELREELKQKEARVVQAGIEIKQAEKALEVARANYKTAQSQVQEAVAGRKRARANCEYRKSESDRIDRLAHDQSIADRIRDEALNQLRSAEAACEEIEARVTSAEAARQESAARRDKAEIDLEAARNQLELAQADQRRLQALVDYARITAPFAGVVSARHVDTGHFLRPEGRHGDANPLFVVERTDRVRVFLEVPEIDAVLVKEGLTACIRVQALNEEEFLGKVAGSSWSLEPGQRTLRTEVDFDNPRGRLRPGMYAHAIIEVEQADAWTLPAATILTRDGQTFCYCANSGKAVRTPVKVGVRRGDVLEILKMQQRPAKPGDKARWVNCTGVEQVIATNPGELTEGQTIFVSAPSDGR